MANGVQFQTSFDHYTTITHRFNSNTGNFAVTAAQGRNGTSCLRSNTTAGSSRAAATLPTALTDIYFAFAWRTSTLPQAGTSVIVAEIRDAGTVQDNLILLSDGTLQVLRNGTTVLGTSSGFAAITNVYYHFEWYIRIHNTLGLVQIRVNNTERMNLTGQDTQATGNNTASEIVLANTSATGIAGNTDFDDVVIRNDGWSGDKQVGAYFPTGTGFTDQWSAVGATFTYQTVDETAPNSDTDYAAASTVSYLSLWTYATMPTSSTIDAVIPLPFAKKTDPGTATFDSDVRLGGVNYPGASKAPSDGSYQYHPDILTTSPATGITWTVSEWNTPIEIGPERLT